MRTAWGEPSLYFSYIAEKVPSCLKDIPLGQPSDASGGDVIIPRYSLMMPIYAAAYTKAAMDWPAGKCSGRNGIGLYPAGRRDSYEMAGN